LAPNANAPSDDLPPSRQTRSAGLPLDVMLGIPGLGIAASAAALALGRYGIMPINERLLNPFVIDVGEQDVAPTATALTVIDVLSAEGYTRLGELVRHATDEPDTVSWLMASEDKQTIAVLAIPYWIDKPALLLMSFFADSALLETRYSSGINIKLPAYEASFVPDSVANAASLHKSLREEMVAKHGSAISVSTVEEYRKLIKNKNPSFDAALRKGIQGSLLSSGLTPLALNLGVLLVIVVLRVPEGNALDFCVLPFAVIFALWGAIGAAMYWRMLRKMAAGRLPSSP